MFGLQRVVHGRRIHFRKHLGKLAVLLTPLNGQYVYYRFPLWLTRDTWLNIYRIILECTGYMVIMRCVV